MRLVNLAALVSVAAVLFAASKQNWPGMRKQTLEALHITGPLPKLEEKEYGSFKLTAEVAADRVSYATDYGLRVPAIVYKPSGATITKHPAMVIVNGHGGDKSSWYAYWAGILYARAGAIVLTYDPIGEYERNAGRQSDTGQHDEVLTPDDMGRRMGGLMVTDVMQGVRYLAQRKDVDPKRIAVLGYSMGSFISALACAVDTDVHACVLAGGGDLDGKGGYWDSSGKTMCQAIPYRSLDFLGDRGAKIYALQAKHAATLVWNGSTDDVVDIPHHGQDFFEDLRRRALGEGVSKKEVFEFGFTPDGGHRPYFLTRPVALWLEEKLRFPEWTKKSVEAMPETRVMDWAAKNNLASPKSLENAHNEGGTMALGSDIPAVSRDQLHALPEAVWDSQRDRYVYETWVDHAQAAIRSGAP